MTAIKACSEQEYEVEADELKMFINYRLLTEQASEKIESDGMKISAVYGAGWILAVEMPGGQKIGAYPISTLNPLAPPSFYIVDADEDDGICNKEPPSKIFKHSKKYCSDYMLLDAIKLLKKAVNSISE